MEEIKYEQAMLRLEEIAQKMENGECDIDELSGLLKEAKRIIKLCKAKLQMADEEIQKILAEDN